MSSRVDAHTASEKASSDVFSYFYWAFVALTSVVVAVALPVVVAQKFGALNLVRSDDWSYIRALFEWNQHGNIDFNGWVSMTLVGQLILARPVVAAFGDSVTSLHIFDAVVGWVGVIGVVALARCASIGKFASLILGIVIAASPMWSTLAPTFMTDVPSFTFCALALALAARALTGTTRSTQWLVASLFCAVVAISVRQYAIVVLGAIFLTFLLLDFAKRPAVPRRTLLLFAAGSIGAVGIILLWWAGVPNRLSLEPQTPTVSSFREAFTSAGGFLRLVSLLLFPVIILARPSGLVRRGKELSATVLYSVLALVMMFLAATYALDSEHPFVGNYVDRRGALGDLIIHGERPYVMPRFAFDALVLVASVTAIVIALTCIPCALQVLERIRSRAFLDRIDPITLLLASMVGGMFIVHEVAIVLGYPIFDRYLLPAIGPLGILVLRSGRGGSSDASLLRGRATAAAGVVAMLVLGGLGIAFAQESASFDAARWKAAELAVDAGFATQDVYAGYEWRGAQTGKSPGFHTSVAERQRHRELYFEGVCVETKVVSRGLMPRVGGRIIAVVPTHGWLRKDAWIVASVTNRACASGKSTSIYR